MARAGIYKSEVVRARDKLLALGRYPSIDAVRIELGNTGSKGTIHRYLKELEEEEGGTAGTKVSVSEALQDLVERLASRLQEEADVRVNEASAKTVTRLQQLTDSITALKSETQATRTQLEHVQLNFADEKKVHADTHAQLREMALERGKLAQEVQDLRERLASEAQHRQSLEEKHKHARESLEHFRQSVKEQREQENRKQAQEVQFLQNELRNVNKALTAKQHETTTAHQECSRLLAELAHAQSLLHGTQEEARKLSLQATQFGFVQKQAADLGLRLVEGELAAKLQEGANHQLRLQAESLAASNQQLELKLATAQASMEAQKSVVNSILQRLNQSVAGGGEEVSKGLDKASVKKSRIPV